MEMLNYWDQNLLNLIGSFATAVTKSLSHSDLNKVFYFCKKAYIIQIHMNFDWGFEKLETGQKIKIAQPR